MTDIILGTPIIDKELYPNIDPSEELNYQHQLNEIKKRLFCVGQKILFDPDHSSPSKSINKNEFMDPAEFEASSGFSVESPEPEKNNESSSYFNKNSDSNSDRTSLSNSTISSSKSFKENFYNICNFEDDESDPNFSNPDNSIILHEKNNKSLNYMDLYSVGKNNFNSPKYFDEINPLFSCNDYLPPLPKEVISPSKENNTKKTNYLKYLSIAFIIFSSSIVYTLCFNYDLYGKLIQPISIKSPSHLPIRPPIHSNTKIHLEHLSPEQFDLIYQSICKQDSNEITLYKHNKNRIRLLSNKIKSGIDAVKRALKSYLKLNFILLIFSQAFILLGNVVI